MRNVILAAGLGLCGAFGALAGCSGDDTSVGPVDGGSDGTTADVAAPDANGSDASEHGDGSDAGDASAPPSPYLVLSYGFDNYQKTEVSAYSLSAGVSAGSFVYTGGGTNQNTASSPWVLDQTNDLVIRMDALAPWKPVASWKVATPKENDAGQPSANAWAIAETESARAYVALYNRNKVAVLDTSAAPDGGAPAKLIDLAGLVQPADHDGYIEVAGAVYVPSKKRVYVLLGNVDLGKVDPQGFFLICSGAKSTIVAIDTTTDTLVTGDGGAPETWTLSGNNPPIGGLVYDAAGDRLLVLTAGCNEPGDGGADAGPGALVGRGVEAIALANGASTVLFDGNAEGYPDRFVYVDGHHAFVRFGRVTHPWDPSTKTLGAPITTAPDAFALDAKGRLVGPRTTYLADGGIDRVEVIAVEPGDGGVTRIGPSPFAHPDPGGYVEGIEVWPGR